MRMVNCCKLLNGVICVFLWHIIGETKSSIQLATVSLITCSHRRHGQDQTVCLVPVVGVNTIGEKTKLSCLVCSCVHTADDAQSELEPATSVFASPLSCQ